jgi:hypothetical protein
MKTLNSSLSILAAVVAVTGAYSTAHAQRAPRSAAGTPVAIDATAIKVPQPVKTVAPRKVLAIQNALQPLSQVTLTPECAVVDYGPHTNVLHYRTGEVRFKMTGNAPAGSTVAVYGSTGGGQVPFANGTYSSAAGMDNGFVVALVDSSFNPVPVVLDLYGAQAINAPGFYHWDWDAAPALNECPVGNVP